MAPYNEIDALNPPPRKFGRVRLLTTYQYAGTKFPSEKFEYAPMYIDYLYVGTKDMKL